MKSDDSTPQESLNQNLENQSNTYPNPHCPHQLVEPRSGQSFACRIPRCPAYNPLFLSFILLLNTVNEGLSRCIPRPTELYSSGPDGWFRIRHVTNNLYSMARSIRHMEPTFLPARTERRWMRVRMRYFLVDEYLYHIQRMGTKTFWRDVRLKVAAERLLQNSKYNKDAKHGSDDEDDTGQRPRKRIAVIGTPYGPQSVGWSVGEVRMPDLQYLRISKKGEERTEENTTAENSDEDHADNSGDDSDD